MKLKAKKGKLTPPSALAEVPSDPLIIKLIKSDKDTCEALSTGFNFEFQTSTDNGANWTKVDIDVQW